MKLYTCTGAPSPRRVTLYLDLKGIKLEQVEVDLRAGEHLKPDFSALSPNNTVPLLLLQDGRAIWETTAIRRYLETMHPAPALFGNDAEAQAEVECWTDWVFLNGMIPVMEAFRNQFEGFRDHALPGRRPVAQIPALVERGRKRFQHFLDDLDQRLQTRPWVAGKNLSVADIDVLVAIEFAERAIKLAPSSEHRATADWRERFSDRLKAAH